MQLQRFRRALASLLTAAMLTGLLASCNELRENPFNDVVISEVMSSNTCTLQDETGNYPDWVELYNPFGSPLSLEGYGLTDREDKPTKFELPAVTIPANGYVVIFLDGGDSYDPETGIIHGSFSVSSAGETVYLYSPGGILLSKAEVGACPSDTSYGIVQDKSSEDYGTYAYFTNPTPGQENTGAHSKDPGVLPASDVKIRINEYMKSSGSILLDEDGDYCGFVEIYNYGEEAVNLEGFGLTDDPNRPGKWRFPAVQLDAGGYLLVYLSGKEKEYTGGNLHASFRLGKDDTALTLTDMQNRAIDALTPVALTQNVSYGRSQEDSAKWLYYPRPTPGAVNDTPGFDSLMTSTPGSTAYVSEAMAANDATWKNGAGEYCDWIELSNPTGQPIALGGWRLSDDETDLNKYRIPDGVQLAPGECLLLYGGAEKTTKGEIYLPFALSAQGETLFLSDADGFLVDVFSTGRQGAGVSSGRGTDDLTARVFFETPTPGQPNPASGAAGYAQAPGISVDGGYVEAGTAVALTAEPGAEIYYTLDGDLPTRAAQLYTGPISIDRTCTLRAVAYLPGRLPSADTARTFLLGERHSIPVVCISTNEENLFDYNTGIFADGPGWTETFPHQGANFWKDWERPVHFEFYDESGRLGIDFNAGIKVFGQYSRAEAQKSFTINLRGKYGLSEVTYPFFRDYDVQTFTSLVLRTSGQDWNRSKLRDAFFAQVIKGQMDLDYMEYRPAAVYINGQYWGLYNIRERLNADYAAAHTGADPDNVDFIKGNRSVKAGSIDAYDELIGYIKTHDLSQQACFDHVAALIDLDCWMNWWITETFFSNTDTGNMKFYRERRDGAKWRWILYDLDWAMASSTYHRNRIDRMLDPKGHGVNKAFSTVIARGLMENAAFQERFIETYARHLNTTFAPARMDAILDRMAAEIRSEIPRQHARWGAPSASRFEKEIEFLHTALAERVALSKQHLQETFGLSDARMQELFPNG